MYFLTSRYKVVTLNPSAVYQSPAYFTRNRDRWRDTLHLRNIDVRRGILKGCINRGHNSCPRVDFFLIRRRGAISRQSIRSRVLISLRCNKSYICVYVVFCELYVGSKLYLPVNHALLN